MKRSTPSRRKSQKRPSKSSPAFSKLSPEQRSQAQQQVIKWAKISISRKSFWHFCQTIAPDFYLDSRTHLRTICESLQALYEGRIQKQKPGDPWQILPVKNQDWITCKKLMMNIPPQHGKSRTLILFSSWAFGRNVKEKIITCSYNDSVASDFSRYTRDAIASSKSFGDEITYADIFPQTRIKRGTASFEKWALEGQHFSYLGAGVRGSVTSKGATILIVDDPVKDAEDALNENAMDKTWLWYSSTFLSRVSAPGGEPIEILNMTRWSKKDPCGRILESEDASNWYQLRMEATDKDKPGIMLCADLLSFKRYLDLKGKQHEGIFNANYHQQAIDVFGVLFQRSKLLRFAKDELTPDGLAHVLGYCDVKDEGNDFLSFPFGKIYPGKVFITDVIFSQDTVDVTLPQSAALFRQLKANYVRVEKNNQGMGFIRDLRKRVPAHQVLAVHNNDAKLSRIWNEFGFIMSNVYFLADKDIVPGSDYDRFLNNVCSYMKDGSSKVDDGPDSLAGLCRFIQSLPHTSKLFPT